MILKPNSKKIKIHRVTKQRQTTKITSKFDKSESKFDFSKSKNLSKFDNDISKIQVKFGNSESKFDFNKTKIKANLINFAKNLTQMSSNSPFSCFIAIFTPKVS